MKEVTKKEIRKKERTKRKVKGWVKLLFFLVIAGVIAIVLFTPPFDVKNYIVEGNNYYTPSIQIIKEHIIITIAANEFVILKLLLNVFIFSNLIHITSLYYFTDL